jgi:hypothetical protein
MVSKHQAIVQDVPCVWPILAAPMSADGHSPDKIIVIICIKRIIVRSIQSIQNNL